MSPVVTLLLLTFPAALISAQEEPFALPIVGGVTSSVGDYPFLVAIVKNVGDRWLLHCGGSILNERYVVTAAHCFHQIQSSVWKTWSVVAGVNNLSSKGSGQVKSLSDVTIHPDYIQDIGSATYVNDIAVVKLDSPLDLQAGLVEKGEFNTVTSCPSSGNTCTVTGWGTTQQGGLASDVRRKCDLQIYSLESCREKSQLPNSVQTTSICAGTKTGGRDTCQGDSGGPLICTCRGQLVVAGIVSCGRGCGRADVPGIYTGVAYFQEYYKYYVNGAPSRMQSTIRATLLVVIAGLLVSTLM